jgi:hypothetical protein
MQMVEIEIDGEDLVVHVKRADKLWALKSELTIPLAHVTDVTRAGPDASAKLLSIKSLGIYVPGVISAGRFHIDGEHVFMDVHHAERAIEIGLEDEKLKKLVLEVEDPDAAIATITAALGS